MKSTPITLAAYYMPGHPKNPNWPEGKDRPNLAGVRMFGGFKFTDGAMSLRLPAHKNDRNMKYLLRFFGVHSEVLGRVDVPSRAIAYSPKSEFEGVLGAVDPNAAAAQGQSSNGSGADGSSGGKSAGVETVRGEHRQRRQAQGSSVATKGAVDPAKAAAAMKDDESGADGLT